MDTAQISALVALLAALPTNGILLFIIVVLYRRTERLTEQLIECAAKKDYPTELVVKADTAAPLPAPPPQTRGKS